MTEKTDIDKIRALAADVDARQGEIAFIKAEVKEMLEMLPEYKELEECAIALKDARTVVKNILLRKQQYNDKMEKISKLQLENENDKYVLSELLIGYTLTTSERQLEVDDKTHEARNIDIKAKLAKGGKKFQTNIFNQEFEEQQTLLDETEDEK